MKKLLSLAAVLLTAALIFTGCQNASSSSDDGDKLPGTWLSTIEYNTWTNDDPFGPGSSFSSKENGAYEYKLTNVSTTTLRPTEGKFRNSLYAVSKDADFTGFKATAKTTASQYYGFVFNINIDANGKWKDYTVVLSDTSFTVDYNDATGTGAELVPWTKNSAIKASPAENNVTVYTDKDSTIHILINGADVHQIKNPVLTQGKVGAVCCFKYTDIANNTVSTTNYNFKEFQKK